MAGSYHILHNRANKKGAQHLHIHSHCIIRIQPTPLWLVAIHRCIQFALRILLHHGFLFQPGISGCNYRPVRMDHIPIHTPPVSPQISYSLLPASCRRYIHVHHADYNSIPGSMDCPLSIFHPLLFQPHKKKNYPMDSHRQPIISLTSPIPTKTKICKRASLYLDCRMFINRGISLCRQWRRIFRRQIYAGQSRLLNSSPRIYLLRAYFFQYPRF